MDVDDDRVLQVELVMDHGGMDTQEVVDLLHFDMWELLQNPERAQAEVLLRAEEHLVGRGLLRLQYLDDEGDWCTLNKETFHDAVQFAVQVQAAPCSTQVHKLLVKVLPASEALPPPSVAVKLEEPAEGPILLRHAEEVLPTASSCSSSSSQRQVSLEMQPQNDLAVTGADAKADVEDIEIGQCLDESVSQAALRVLLKHPEELVRKAAKAAIAQAKQECEDEQKEENLMQDMEKAEVVQPQCLLSGPPPRVLSASVISGTPLVLGIEAEEEQAVKGDVTAEFAEDIAQAGARQAFRLGRVALPTGAADAPAVPICAKVVVLNDGQAPWPETAAVTLVAGEAFGFPKMDLGALKPGEAAELVLDLTVAPRLESGSQARSSWAIVDSSNGSFLGPVLILEVLWNDLHE